jgi:hypothetical protein
MHDGLLTPAQSAVILNVAVRTLEAWRRKGYGPQHLRLSPRAVRYRLEDLVRWINQQAHEDRAVSAPAMSPAAAPERA